MKAEIDTKVAAVRIADISLVLPIAGWSRERIFAMFYNKPISLLPVFLAQNLSCFEVPGEAS